MPYVESTDGVKLAVEVVGQGEPVTVVGHGLTAHRGVFGVLAPFLAGTSVLFDFRGHGESDRPPPGSYTYDHFAADIETVSDTYGVSRVVGFSLGAGAALRLLESRPDRFQRMVFILPARLEQETSGRTRLLRLAEVLESHTLEEAAEIIVEEERELVGFAQPGDEDIRRRGILEMNREGIPNAIRELAREPAIRDPDALRAAVTTPALVIGQEGDGLHYPEVARELAGALANSELVILPDPSAWVEELHQLVARVSAFVASP